MRSKVSNQDLIKVRDELNTLYKGARVTANDIQRKLDKDNGIKLDVSTIRGRFIAMGEALGGPNYGKATIKDIVDGKPTPTPAPAPVSPAEMPSPPPKTVKRKLVVTTPTINPELQQYIPKAELFSNYIERNIDQRLAMHYDLQASGHECKYPITQGKQGTGKTFGHMYYAFKKQLPFFLFSCFEDFKLAKLFGDKTIINGSIKFQESEFVKAIQSASVILFDEVNAVSQANTYDFHALLQNRRLFIKDAEDGKGKIFDLNPHCRIGFAQNPKSAKYIGGNIRASNFLGRCTFLTYPEFTLIEIQKSIKKKYPEMIEEDVVKFSKFYDACIQAVDQSQIPLDISIRQLNNVIELWLYGMPLEWAIEDGLANMVEAISQPKAKEAFKKLAEATWKELLP